MGFDKSAKLLPILNFEVVLRSLSSLRADIPGLGSTLKPQVNRIATDIEQVAGLTFLETIPLDRLHDFLPEVFAVGFSHSQEGRDKRNIFSLRLNLDEYSYITRN
jgi:hypothetical protein